MLSKSAVLRKKTCYFCSKRNIVRTTTMSEQELFVIIDFVDGSRDASMKCIVEPRKDYGRYKVGEEVIARCYGWKGTHKGTIAAIHEDRSVLRSWLHKGLPLTVDKAVISNPSNSKKNGNEGDDGRIESSNADSMDQGSEKEENIRGNETKETRKDGDKAKKKAIQGSEKEENTRGNETEKTRKEGAQAKKKNVDKKRSLSQEETDDPDIQAKLAKKEMNKKKREKESAVETGNIQLSEVLLSGQNNSKASSQEAGKMTVTSCPELEKKMDILLEKVENLTQAVKAVKEDQKNTQSLIVDLINCPKCLRTRYKLIQSRERNLMKDLGCSPLAPLPAASPPLRTASPLPPPLQTTSSSSQQPLTPVPTTGDVITTPVQHQEQKEDTLPVDAGECEEDVNINGSELVYLGEAKYSVKMKKENLDRARVTSKNAVKFALNLLEFLVTPEECKANLTVYGEGAGKRPLDENKRRALRSEIFNKFFMNEMEAEKMWQETIVPKLNNKIRGIRNNKYKTV